MNDAEKKMFRDLSEKVYVMGVVFVVVIVLSFFLVINDLAANGAESNMGVLCTVVFFLILKFLYNVIILSDRIYKFTKR